MVNPKKKQICGKPHEISCPPFGTNPDYLSVVGDGAPGTGRSTQKPEANKKHAEGREKDVMREQVEDAGEALAPPVIAGYRLGVYDPDPDNLGVGYSDYVFPPTKAGHEAMKAAIAEYYRRGKPYCVGVFPVEHGDLRAHSSEVRASGLDAVLRRSGDGPRSHQDSRNRRSA